MKSFLVFFVTLFFPVWLAGHEYHFEADWLTPPMGMAQIGDSHGEIAVDSNGLVYVSVAGGDKPGIQVYSREGKYLRNVPNSRANHHGFTIVNQNGKEYIYAACLGGDTAAIKLSLDGEVLLTIPTHRIPKSEWIPHPKRPEQGPGLALTHIDVAPNKDIYIIDGYRSDKIFVFDYKGIYKKRIAGKKAPYNFNNAHKFAVDRRFEPARLLVCDRNNRRLVHLSLEGDLIGEVATELRRPSSIAFYKDLVGVAEINGRVSVLDKRGKMVSQMGANENPEEVDTNRVEPGKWREGTVTSPHGIAFDGDGNVLMAEWNKWGRVLRWER